MRLTVKHDGSRQRKILCAGTTMKMADDNKLLGIEVRIEVQPAVRHLGGRILSVHGHKWERAMRMQSVLQEKYNKNMRLCAQQW